MNSCVSEEGVLTPHTGKETSVPHLPGLCKPLLLTQVGRVVLQCRGELIFQGGSRGEKVVTFFEP